MSRHDPKHGSCLCGSVAFAVTGPLRPVIACHCRQCRKQTGHYMAATATKLTYFNLTCDKGLAWYRASDTAQRGFCKSCGATLFWQGDDADYMAIAAGSFDDDLGVALAGHIYCDFAGEYYEILGGTFQKAQSGHGIDVPD